MTSGGLAAVSSSAFAALYSAFGKYDVVHIHAEGPAFFAWLPKMFVKRVVVNGIQFIQVLLEANGLAAGKDHQFKGRYDAEKNAVIISLEKDEREW